VDRAAESMAKCGTGEGQQKTELHRQRIEDANAHVGLEHHRRRR
jgi:hypothetical protein